MITRDYLLRYGASLFFDKLTQEYPNKTVIFCKLYRPASGTILPEDMHRYRTPHVRSSMPPEPSWAAVLHFAPTVTPYVDPALAPILSSVYTENSGGHHFCLQTVPILTGYLTPEESDRISHRPLYHHEIPVISSELIPYTFAIYRFNSGHILQLHHNTPIDIDVALLADTRPSGRAVFKQFTKCPSISNSADDLLRRIQSSSVSSNIHGYFLHSHCFRKRETEHIFWTVQSAIVRALCAKRGLEIFWAFVHPSWAITLANGFC